MAKRSASSAVAPDVPEGQERPGSEDPRRSPGGVVPAKELEGAALLKELLDTLPAASGLKAVGEAEVGPVDPFVRPDVEVELTPSRQLPIAGELWSMLGTIRNRSNKPIWIVDAKTVLTLAPEMWGQTSRRGSMGAFFPTVRSRPTDEIVRIDPQCEYAVVWKVDTYERSENKRFGIFEVFARIASAIKDFAFFNPGRFTVSATVHVWPVPPTVAENGTIDNPGESLPITVTSEVDMEASPWVLILGAIIGGTLSFILQLLATYAGTDLGGAGGVSLGLLAVGIGFLVAVLLPAITTILLSRLATTDFLLVVKVKDIWGAIATGFIIQWFGYSGLLRLLETVSLGSP
jgi:hypothetical protein